MDLFNLGLLYVGVLAWAFSGASAQPTPYELKLGFVWPMSHPNYYSEALASLQVAVDQINSRTDVLPNTHVTIVDHDSWVPGARSVLETQGKAIQAAYLASQEAPFGVVGDYFAEVVPYSALVTTGYKIPSCVPATGVNDISNKVRYPYTVRLGTPYSSTGTRLVDFIASYGWKKMAYAYSPGSYGSSFYSGVMDGAKKHGIQILLQQTIALGQGEPKDYQNPAQNIKDSGARIILVTAYNSEATQLYIEAAKLNLTTPEYVWIAVQSMSETKIGKALGADAARDMAVFYQVLPDYDNTTEVWQKFEKDFYASNPSDYGIWGEVYDCGMTLMYGFDAGLKQSQQDASLLEAPNFQDPKMAGFLNLTNFNSNNPGITGPLTFDEYGDFSAAITLIKVKYNATKSGSSWSAKSHVISSIDSQGNITQIAEPVFAQGTKLIPFDAEPSKPQNPPWKGIGGVFAALSVILILTGLASAVITVWFKDNAIIKRSSWKSLLMVAIGTVIANISPLLYIGSLNKAMCIGQPFVLNVGFGLAFSNLLAKTWRVYKIFNNPRMAEMAIKDIHLLCFSVLVVLVELIISIIWVAHDTPTVRSFSITEFEHMLICESASTNFQKALTTTSMAFNGLLLLLTTILCWKTRDVNALYNETKWIGISVYNIVACCAVFLPLIYNSDFVKFSFILRSLAVIIGTGMLQVCMFGPKFLQMTSGRGKEGVPDMSILSQGSTTKPRFSAGKPGTDAKSFEIQQLFRLQNVPVLEIGSSKRFFTLSLSFFARWKRAEVILCPGLLYLELQVRPGESRQFRSYRTAGALVHLEAEDAASKEKDDLRTVTVTSVDGTLEFMVSNAIAVEIQKMLAPVEKKGSISGPSGPAAARTSSMSK